jgi:hypothetical protein
MRFSVGGVFAQCAGCGEQDFFPALALNPGRQDVYVCAHCGNEAVRSELVRRVGERGLRSPAPAG